MTYPKPLKVAVLMGGIGPERDVSLISGSCVSDALKSAEIEVAAVDITPEKLDILDDQSIDVFFAVLHGEFGEDGQLQKIMEDKDLTFTGSGSRACELAMDKVASKKAFLEAKVAVPKYFSITAEMSTDQIMEKAASLGENYVIKPAEQGSSIGISMTDNVDKVGQLAKDCLKTFGSCMVEQYITGREVTVGVFCGQALSIIEIKTCSDFYDYNAKYADKSTKFLFDTINDYAMQASIKSAALDCFEAVGCRDFARVDFRLDENSIAYALELNAIPGFTTRSDLPKAAAKDGISMNQLCKQIVMTAMDRKNA